MREAGVVKWWEMVEGTMERQWLGKGYIKLIGSDIFRYIIKSTIMYLRR